MVAILGCRSGDAFDSLPRDRRRSTAAIHRLQQAQAGRSSTDEFGGRSSMSKETDIHFAPSTAAASPRSQPGSPSASGNRRALSSASGGGFRRSIDGARPGRTASMLRKSKSTGAKSALAQRSPPVSSDMYPIVSSDLDLEREEEARYGGRLGGGRSAPSSPPGTPTLRDVPGTSAPGSPQTKMAIGSPIPRKDMRSFAPSSPSPARKRVVDKGMIGLPTNFQHTGHIGASSYRSAVVDSAQLQAHLSEVAAALNFDLSTPASTEVAKPPALTRSVPSEPFSSGNSPAMVPAGSVALAERPQGSQATPLDANDSSAAPLRPATPPAVVGIETAAHPTATPPASLPGLFDRPAHSSGSPRAGGAPSTLGYGAPAPASPSSARQVAATAGIGRRKRKPVPRPLDEDDAQISPSEGSPKGASGLDRQLSVLGELPKQFSDCPLQRAQARADAAAESEPLAEVENDGNGLGLGLGSDDGETAQAAVGQAEKKKVLVGATYMTDTANVRWNSALAEITQALAADGQEADKSNGGAAKGKGNDDEEDFEQAMQQADAVLSRLGHDV